MLKIIYGLVLIILYMDIFICSMLFEDGEPYLVFSYEEDSYYTNNLKWRVKNTIFNLLWITTILLLVMIAIYSIYMMFKDFIFAIPVIPYLLLFYSLCKVNFFFKGKNNDKNNDDRIILIPFSIMIFIIVLAFFC